MECEKFSQKIRRITKYIEKDNVVDIAATVETKKNSKGINIQKNISCFTVELNTRIE